MYITRRNYPSAAHTIVRAAFAFIILLTAACHGRPWQWGEPTYSVRYDRIGLHNVVDSLQSYGYLVFLKGDTAELVQKFVPVTLHASNVGLRHLLDSIFNHQPKLGYNVYIISTEIIIQKK